MSLIGQVLITASVSAVLLLALLVVVVGPKRIGVALGEIKPRFRSIIPYLGVMVTVLLTRALTQDYAEQLTNFLDLNLTSLFFSIEGGIFGYIQAIQFPELSAYLGFMYLFGYVIIVAFPALAYFCLPSLTHLKELLAAYIVNDVVGITLYVIFTVYGPRNLGRGFAQPILYDIYPDAVEITGTVNVPINVFPSLHASMAATVIIFSWRTRHIYPVWTVVATVYGGSVIFSTMYLGMHWISDVLAGLVLAVGAVYIGTRVAENEERIGTRVRQAVSRG